MPSGVNPYAAYPFMLHQQFQLPWNIQIINSRLTLHSIHYQGDAVINLKSCHECEGLLTNNVVEGIRNRIERGVHENSPLAYQSIAGLIELVQRKNEQLQILRLTKHTISQRLATHVKTIDEYKKFVMVLGEGKMSV